MGDVTMLPGCKWTIPSSVPGSLPWGATREFTSDESNDIERFLPQVETACVIGEKSTAYNCLAWSVGITNQVLYPSTDHNDVTTAAFRAFFLANSFEELQYHDPDECHVVCWSMFSGSIYHVSVCYPDVSQFSHDGDGHGMSSKLGFDPTDTRGAASLLVAHSYDEMIGEGGRSAGLPALYFKRVDGPGCAETNDDPGADEPGPSTGDDGLPPGHN